jgi:tetratricopeptide (TPR) repeat protein
MKPALMGLCFLLLAVGAADAATPYDLYAAGKYDDAIAAGIKAGDAQGLAIAARSELAEEQMRDAPCLECLQRAEKYARRAVAADSKFPDGHTWIAVSLGYEARLIGRAAATVKLYPSTAKSELDTALKIDPGNVWALAALGGWNVEAVRAIGPRLARWTVGASMENARMDFDTAFATAPDSVPLRYQYALSLSGYDLAAYRKEIESTLTHVESMKPGTTYDAFAKARAVQLLAALRKDNLKRYDALVYKFQGYP